MGALGGEARGIREMGRSALRAQSGVGVSLCVSLKDDGVMMEVRERPCWVTAARANCRRHFGAVNAVSGVLMFHSISLTCNLSFHEYHSCVRCYPLVL